MEDKLPITPSRMIELIDGHAVPEDNNESLFLTAFGEAAQGILLEDLMEEIGQGYIIADALMTEDELVCMILGYMKGQKARSELYDIGGNEEQDYILIPIENKKTH